MTVRLTPTRLAEAIERLDRARTLLDYATVASDSRHAYREIELSWAEAAQARTDVAQLRAELDAVRARLAQAEGALGRRPTVPSGGAVAAAQVAGVPIVGVGDGGGA